MMLLEMNNWQLSLCMMIELFLSKVVWGDNENADSADSRMSLYSELEEIIWRLITPEVESEARLWLSEAISSIGSITPPEQRDLFMRFFRSESLTLNVATQVIQILSELRPQQAGLILAKKCCRLETFFKVAIDADGSRVTVSWNGDFRRNVIVWMGHRAVNHIERINASNSPVLQCCGGSLSPETKPPKVPA